MCHWVICCLRNVLLVTSTVFVVPCCIQVYFGTLSCDFLWDTKHTIGIKNFTVCTFLSRSFYIYVFRQFHNWSIKLVKRTLLLTDRISLALADTSAQTFQVSLAIRTLCDKPTLVPDCLNRSHQLLQLCRNRTNSDSKHPSSLLECKELLGNYPHPVFPVRSAV